MDDESARELKFEKLLQAIHARPPESLGTPSMDTSRAEMLAMFDSFLGEDFDAMRRDTVISLQQNLHRGQSLLARQLETYALTEEEYVERFNHLLSTVFEACEHVLGQRDFEALFGAPRADMQGYIDKDAFLASRRGQVPVPVKAPAEHTVRQPHQRTVLIVDDSSHYHSLNAPLRRAGCRVLEAKTSWAALEMLQSHHPDLMLVDIDMPTISGYELVDIVHRRPETANMVVMMMAPHITKTTFAEAACVGASHVLAKATPRAELVSLISRSLSH